MKIFISELDRYHSYRAAILPLAQFHKIENYEFKSLYELYLELKELSSIFDSLDAYLTAYEKWFAFYAEKKIIIEGNSSEDYELEDSEKIDLSKLIIVRDGNLKKLIDAFDELKTNKF